MRLSTLAEALGATLEGDGGREVYRISTLSNADGESLSFLGNPRYLKEAVKSKAGAVIVPEDCNIKRSNLLKAKSPYLALANAIEILYPEDKEEAGISKFAFISEKAVVGHGVYIGNFSVISDSVKIGSNVHIGDGSFIGKNCQIGNNAYIYPNVVIYPDTVIGNNCIIHSGAILGSDGFGFAFDGEKHVKIRQIGRLVIEDDVEIGANSTIDRGAIEETRIGKGTKIDNLVQIGHNVTCGKNCILVAQSGISGSTTLGDDVILAGQSGIVGHVKVGDHSRIGAKSAVTKDLPESSFVSGFPARNHKAFLRERALLLKLDDLFKRVAKMEKSLKKEKGRK